MAFMDWSEDYSVNVEQVDTQHKKLFAMLNDYYDGLQQRQPKEALGKLLSQLVDYTVFHFKFEESYFDRFKYQDTVAHKREHAALIAKVTDITERVKAGKMVLSLEIGTFLKDWLNHHIKGTDKQYSKCFNDNGLK